MRDLTGKAARIKEKRDYTTKNEKKAANKVEAAKAEATKTAVAEDK